MEKNKFGVCLLILCICILSGCTQQSTDNFDESRVQDWIPSTKEPIIVKDEEIDAWQLCIGEETLEVENSIEILGDMDLYCNLDIFRSAKVVSGGIFPTYIVDTNGLRCVGMELKPDVVSGICNVMKHYVLSDGTIIQYEDSVLMTGIVVQNQELFAMESLCEILGWEYKIDFEKKEIEISGEYVDSVFYEMVFPKLESNRVWTTDGRFVRADELCGEDYRNKFAATSPEYPIEVVPGQVLKIDYYLSWISDIAGILFLDDDGNVVYSYNSKSSVSVSDMEVVVPKGATQMHVTYYGNCQYKVCKKVERTTLNAYAELQASYEDNRITVMTESASNSLSNIKMQFDKAYITFMLDDCRPDMDVVADIFAEYDVPLCVAAVWECMHAPASRGEYTRMDICHQIVENGGEILAHDGEVLTEELLTDNVTMEKHFVFDKYCLEQNGFEINGIILAGGSGQIVGSSQSDLWSRIFYRYSDLYGEQSSGEPYYHRRFWLGNCLDDYKRIIAEAISEKEWVCFYFHDLKEVDEEKLREILTYVTSVSEGLEVVNYKTIYSSVYGAE